jgi:hypothetical protein
MVKFQPGIDDFRAVCDSICVDRTARSIYYNYRSIGALPTSYQRVVVYIRTAFTGKIRIPELCTLRGENRDSTIIRYNQKRPIGI